MKRQSQAGRNADLNAPPESMLCKFALPLLLSLCSCCCCCCCRCCCPCCSRWLLLPHLITKTIANKSSSCIIDLSTRRAAHAECAPYVPCAWHELKICRMCPARQQQQQQTTTATRRVATLATTAIKRQQGDSSVAQLIFTAFFN